MLIYSYPAVVLVVEESEFDGWVHGTGILGNNFIGFESYKKQIRDSVVSSDKYFCVWIRLASQLGAYFDLKTN